MNLKIFFVRVWNLGPDTLFLSNALNVIWLTKWLFVSAENVANSSDTSQNYLRYKIEVNFLDFFLVPISHTFCEQYYSKLHVVGLVAPILNICIVIIFMHVRRLLILLDWQYV